MNSYKAEIHGHNIELCLGETGSCSPWFIDACIEHDINLMISADMHWWMKIDDDIYSVDVLTDPDKLIALFKNLETYDKNFDYVLEELLSNQMNGYKFEKEIDFQEFLNKRKKK